MENPSDAHFETQMVEVMELLVKEKPWSVRPFVASTEQPALYHPEGRVGWGI